MSRTRCCPARRAIASCRLPRGTWTGHGRGCGCPPSRPPGQAGGARPCTQARGAPAAAAPWAPARSGAAPASLRGPAAPGRPLGRAPPLAAAGPLARLGPGRQALDAAPQQLQTLWHHLLPGPLPGRPGARRGPQARQRTSARSARARDTCRTASLAVRSRCLFAGGSRDMASQVCCCALLGTPCARQLA